MIRRGKSLPTIFITGACRRIRVLASTGLCASQLENAKKRIHKRVSVGYTRSMAEKDAGLRIRVERSLRERFVEACRSEDKPAAQVIRDFMRSYVESRQPVHPPCKQTGTKRGAKQSDGAKE